MKCKNCGHGKHDGICRVMVPDLMVRTVGSGYDKPCNCNNFQPVEFLAPLCPGCEQPLVFNFAQMQPPNTNVVVAQAWCTGCGHLLVTQVLGALVPTGPRTN
jgi:hypothetical protein